MTAEVAVMNTGAVALAADSAVTIGDRKIYNSAIKLFSLSKVAPVAIMVFGNAVLMGIPWELIIKAYRHQLKARRFQSLADYANDFIKYIEGSDDFLSEKAGEQWLLERTLDYWVHCRNEIEDQIQSSLEDSSGGLEPKKIEDAFVNYLKKHKGSLKKKADLDIPASTLASARDQITRIAEQYGQVIFGDLYEKLEGELIEVGFLLFSKEIFPSSVSGIVIAGFGESQFFPALEVYDVEGGLPGYLRRKHDKEKSQAVSTQMPATIVPFAQDDMIATFMEGINPSFGAFFNVQLKHLLSEMPEALAKVVGKGKKETEELKAKLNEVCRSLGDHFRSTLEGHRHKEHISPILQMVSVLPKNELAEMAETLVNLTAFKRRVTHSIESVGGPVDVCIISKGDGLVWVKRKHYFPSELNHNFYSNYREGIS